MSIPNQYKTEIYKLASFHNSDITKLCYLFESPKKTFEEFYKNCKGILTF